MELVPEAKERGPGFMVPAPFLTITPKAEEPVGQTGREVEMIS